MIGAAFGLSAYFLGRTLVNLTPAERQVAEGKSLRRFRVQAIGLSHLLILSALLFATWRLTGLDPGYGNDTPVLSWITFMVVQMALGWPWSNLGTKAVPDRPDAARV